MNSTTLVEKLQSTCLWTQKVADHIADKFIFWEVFVTQKSFEEDETTGLGLHNQISQETTEKEITGWKYKLTNAGSIDLEWQAGDLI